MLDAQGGTTSASYDAMNRPTLVRQPDGREVRYAYDTRGNLASITDPLSHATSYTCDGFGQLLTQTSPETGKTTYSYDNAGRCHTAQRAQQRHLPVGQARADRTDEHELSQCAPASARCTTAIPTASSMPLTT